MSTRASRPQRSDVQREEEPGEYAERVSDAPARPQEQDALRAAIDAAEIGTWSWDIASGRVAWTPRTYQVFGYELVGRIRARVAVILIGRGSRGVQASGLAAAAATAAAGTATVCVRCENGGHAPPGVTRFRSM